MTAILTNATTATPSASQTATGSTILTASGTFAGAQLVIETNPDSLGYAPVITITEPSSLRVTFAVGQPWRARLTGPTSGTSVSLSALAE